jgi:hypothetical protein
VSYKKPALNPEGYENDVSDAVKVMRAPGVNQKGYADT